MAFTDEDLQRLNDNYNGMGLPFDKMAALIHRLECAEKALNCDAPPCDEGPSLFRAWQKSAGKDGR